MKFLVFLTLTILASSVLANDCTVSDYDHYQHRQHSKQTRKILKEKGFNPVKESEQPRFLAGEVCYSLGEDDFCELKLSDRETGKIHSWAKHREGRTLIPMLKQALTKTKDFSQIKSCNQIKTN